MADCLGIDLGGQAAPAAKLAEKLDEQIGIAIRRVSARATQLRTGVLAHVGPDQLPHRGLAQRLGTKYGRARFQQQRSQKGPLHICTGSDGQRDDDRQTGQPIREVQQEAQGWFVGPLGVVDRQGSTAHVR